MKIKQCSKSISTVMQEDLINYARYNMKLTPEEKQYIQDLIDLRNDEATPKFVIGRTSQGMSYIKHRSCGISESPIEELLFSMEKLKNE